MNQNILFAGFGGQGILFSGKVIAYAGLMEGMEISWLPSYGPEMRGGTANCSVCLSERPIGSPLVVTPNILVVMNLPSLEKFEKEVVPGGTIIIDSSIIDKKVEREDVKVIYIPASKLAEQNGLKGSANMIIVGKLFKEIKFCSRENLDKGIAKSVPPKKEDLLEKNMRAIQIGLDN
jgi:2-oxoglutarate ferredoxin oxidoreductase subunit gamma